MRVALALAAAAVAAAGAEGAGAGPCLPALGSKMCPVGASDFVYSQDGQLVCNCAKGSTTSGLVNCSSGHANPRTLPLCNAAVVPQAPMPCVAGAMQCPLGSGWFQSNQVNVCFCEGGLENKWNNLFCDQNNVSWNADVKSLPSCSAEPAFVTNFPCKAAGRLCASGWVKVGDEMMCNCDNPVVNGDSLSCDGQNVPVDKLGLCSEGEPTAKPTALPTLSPTQPTSSPTQDPTPSPTKRTLPPVPQVACEVTLPPSSSTLPPSSFTLPPTMGVPTGLCYLPSKDYCCNVNGNSYCYTSTSNNLTVTCGFCACTDPDTSAAARPASGAAALLGALLLLTASL